MAVSIMASAMDSGEREKERKRDTHIDTRRVKVTVYYIRFAPAVVIIVDFGTTSQESSIFQVGRQGEVEDGRWILQEGRNAKYYCHTHIHRHIAGREREGHIQEVTSDEWHETWKKATLKGHLET